MEQKETVSIEWESTGYSVLKNLNATVLGIFTEFIDNSIQSYLDKREELEALDPNYKLKVEISYDETEIVIEDNAGGINTTEFKRALKPANKPDDTKGLNEFGLGMKYAAVWISNEWELCTSAIGEDVQRTVVFNYQEVTSKNIKTLTPKILSEDRGKHYTRVTLRQLEQKHVVPFQWKYIKEKLAFIYRNFLRPDNTFYSFWKSADIDLIVFGEKLDWQEFGFLNQQWYYDRQILQIESPFYEWKYKFDWMKIPFEEEVMKPDGSIVNEEKFVEVSGFVGILPDGELKHKNGFVLFRRGRVIEGIDSRVYPRDISGSYNNSHKYLRLYGEIHFRHVDISFDKTKLSISSERRDEIFYTISLLIKNLDFDGKKYDLIKQASEHRSKFIKEEASNTVTSYLNKKKTQRSNEKAQEVISELIEGEKFEEELQKDLEEHKKNVLPETELIPMSLSNLDYLLKVLYTESSRSLYIVQHNIEEREIILTINMNHVIFKDRNELSQPDVFNVLVSSIKSAAISQIRISQGNGNVMHFQGYFDEFIQKFI